MCLAFFEGKGYSPEFTAHMQGVVDRLKENPALCVVAQGDLICSKCPNLEQGVCSSADKVHCYDQQVLDLCGLSEGAQVDWNTFSRLVMEKILTIHRLEKVCGDCRWTDICKSKQAQLLGEPEHEA